MHLWANFMLTLHPLLEQFLTVLPPDLHELFLREFSELQSFIDELTEELCLGLLELAQVHSAMGDGWIDFENDLNALPLVVWLIVQRHGDDELQI